MQSTTRVTIYIDELSILEARHGQIVEVLLYGVFVEDIALETHIYARFFGNGAFPSCF